MNITYRYERTGSYPGGGAALSAGLARHHILSYPFMRSFAVVTYQYIATHGSDQIASKAIEKLNGFYKARGVGIAAGGWFDACKHFNNKSNLEKEVEDAKSYLSWICWAESNLFIGPIGEHRIDDPSQKMDQFPLNMDDKVKSKATEVKEAWDKICKSSLVGEKDQIISLKIDEKELPNFVETFVEYICLSKPTVIYKSKYKDWAAYLATDTSRKKPYQFWLNQPKSGDVIKKERYQFALRDKEADAKEPCVCITDFGNDSVLGIEKKGLDTTYSDNTF